MEIKETSVTYERITFDINDKALTLMTFLLLLNSKEHRVMIGEVKVSRFN